MTSYSLFSLSVRPVVVISLPDWLYQYQKEIQNRTFITDEDMMDVAIQISAMNVQYNTGGPFGTAIFSRAKLNGNKIALVACGCNRVVPLQNSVLHGETTAIQFAEHVLQTHSLAATDTHEYILCTSCEPCCMCLGSILWSKVSELHCSGTKADAEAIGFDEGPVFPESYKSLEAAGIKVKFQISLKESQQVLQKYGETGIIY
jgi:tRNA(Arg) A34 adenosine deaminase TadA